MGKIIQFPTRFQVGDDWFKPALIALDRVAVSGTVVADAATGWITEQDLEVEIERRVTDLARSLGIVAEPLAEGDESAPQSVIFSPRIMIDSAGSAVVIYATLGLLTIVRAERRPADQIIGVVWAAQGNGVCDKSMVLDTIGKLIDGLGQEFARQYREANPATSIPT